MTTNFEVQISAGNTTRVPLLFRKGTPVKAGVYGRKEPIGWNRFYKHLLKQASVEGAKANKKVPGDNDNEARERWVLKALKALAAYDPEAHPDRISYADAVDLLKATKVLKKPFVAFDPDLYMSEAGDEKLSPDALRQKREQKELWFSTESKYAALFPDAKPEREYWWSPVEKETVPFGGEDGPGHTQPTVEALPEMHAAPATDRFKQYLMLGEGQRDAAARRLIEELKARLRPDSGSSPKEILDSVKLVNVAVGDVFPTTKVRSFSDAELARLILDRAPVLDTDLAVANDKLATYTRDLVANHLRKSLTVAKELADALNRLGRYGKGFKTTLVGYEMWMAFQTAMDWTTYEKGVFVLGGRSGYTNKDEGIIALTSFGPVDPDAAFTGTGDRRAAGIKLLHTYVHEWVHTVTAEEDILVGLHAFQEALTSMVATDILRGDPKLKMELAEEPRDGYSDNVGLIENKFDSALTRTAVLHQFLKGESIGDVLAVLNGLLEAAGKPRLGIDELKISP